MNIIDAIKTGKRFKREGWDKFHSKIEYTIIDFDTILADDWEVEIEPGTITREQFDAAWSKIWPNDPQFEHERNLIAEELGL